jgi:hypothetical protein
MIAEIAPYITIFTAIIVAYLTYRNQLRLKTFEMLIDRRNSVLVDIEKFISELYRANLEFVCDEIPMVSTKYSREYFHEGMILMHKIKGSNFGSSVDVLNSTFWQIITNPGYNEPAMSKEQFRDWLSRTTNVVSLIYGLAHSELTKELEKMALPWVSRKYKTYKNRKTFKS